MGDCGPFLPDFSEKSRSPMHNHIRFLNTKPSFRKITEPIPGKLSDGRTEPIS